MGQGEVIKVLEKFNKPLTSTEIAKCLKIGGASVRRILHTLMKDKTLGLKFRPLTFEEKKKRYGAVINSPFLRVYWLK